MFDKFITLFETPFTKRRIGKDGDGGYVIIDNNLKGYSGLIGMGIKDDNSFEMEFQDISNCYVQQYDYSIDEPPSEIPNSDFFKVKVEKQSDLVDLDKLGDRRFMKMDIEGSEWDLLKDIDLSKFEQIACELHFHSFNDPLPLERLTEHHNFVHAHANSCDFSFIPYITKDGTIAMLPQTIEFTLLRKDLCEFSPNRTWYPTPLDQSCDTRPDFDMRMYPFAPII